MRVEFLVVKWLCEYWLTVFMRVSERCAQRSPTHIGCEIVQKCPAYYWILVHGVSWYICHISASLPFSPFGFQACPVRKMIIEQLQSVPPICGGMVQNLFWNFTHFLWFSIYKYFQFNFPRFQGVIWKIFSQGFQNRSYFLIYICGFKNFKIESQVVNISVGHSVKFCFRL